MKAESGLSYLQQKEIELGIRNGLKEEQLSVFAKSRLNYLQMRLLRTAMEDGLDTETAAKLARSGLPYRDMEEALSQIREGVTPDMGGRKKLTFMLYPIAAAVPVLCAVILVYLLKPNDPLFLDLYSDEIRLSSGAVFEPLRYVKDCTENAELILPESFETGQPETRVVCYEIRNGEETVQKLLRIVICDETSPKITLLKEDAEILKAGFSCRDFLLYAEDETDGDLTERVQCSSDLGDEEYQEVVYTVSDNSGNSASQILRVHINDMDLPDIAAVSAEQKASGESTQIFHEVQPAVFEPYEEYVTESWTETINEDNMQVIVDHNW